MIVEETSWHSLGTAPSTRGGTVLQSSPSEVGESALQEALHGEQIAVYPAETSFALTGAAPRVVQRAASLA
jgi:hypothetical protein